MTTALSKDEFEPSSSGFLEPEGLESPTAVPGEMAGDCDQPLSARSGVRERPRRGFLRSSRVAVGDGTNVASQIGRSWIFARRSQDLDLLRPRLDSAALEGFAGCPTALGWLGHTQKKHGKVSCGFSSCIYFFKARLSAAAKRFSLKQCDLLYFWRQAPILHEVF